MNGITASKTTALFCSMIIIFGLIVAIISFYAFSADIIKNQKFSLEPFIYGFGGVLVSVLSFLEMNRTACHVWIENGVLKTKGQFLVVTENVELIVLRVFFPIHILKEDSPFCI